MNKILAYLFLIGSIGNFINCTQSNKTFAPVKNEISKKAIDDSFDIKLQIDKVDNELYSMSTTIELEDESYVISYFSEDDFYLPFTIDIDDTNRLVSDDNILEIPQSLPEIDPILNKPVRFVRTNTTYKQNLKVVGQEDFEVTGLIEFLLEPSCVPYDVAFVISYQSGEMSIKKTSTIISKEYKG